MLFGVSAQCRSSVGDKQRLLFYFSNGGASRVEFTEFDTATMSNTAHNIQYSHYCVQPYECALLELMEIFEYLGKGGKA